MTQPPTPDAVRAAIAEVIWFSERDSSTGGVPAKLPPDMAKRVDAIYDRLSRIGALRPVEASMSEAATSVLDREMRHMIVDKWLVSRLGFAESAGHIDEVIADLLDELDAVPAAGRDDVLPIGMRVHVNDRMGHGIDGEIVEIDYVIKTDSGLKLTYTRKWIEPIDNGADDGE